MASELLPCPFCGGTDLSSGGDDKFVGYFCKTCQATGPNHYGSRDWNTRPAPAATDTGLETVGYQYHNGAWYHADSPDKLREFGFKTRELVTRSQAEELLAAEREKVLFLKTAMEIAQTHCGLKDKTIDSLEADNAAKDARIKETEDCYLRLCEAIGVTATNAAPIDASEKLRALEAKLAAAEKALEPFADIAGVPWADENGWTDAACQNDRIVDWFGPSAFLAARAVLGWKP